jgi:TolB-like protein/DNA-binding winged helix-turn-helix (wHTH) protein/Flp pilus assembly protein TadD
MSGSEPYLIYEFVGFRLDPRRRSLTRTTGETVELTGKALDALIHLVEHAGELIPRAALMNALWPRTIVEDNSLSQVISGLRRVLGDDRDGSRLIATVSGRGYQFVGHVRAATYDEPAPAEPAPSAENAGSSLSSPTRPFRLHRLAWLGALVVALVVALLAIGRYVVDSREPSGVPPSRVAVLPFRDLSPNADDAYFAAGLHEEVLNRLAKIDALTVIGRTSVMGYADTALPLSTIATELGVGAVLEGSASSRGERVRVSVRLVAATTAAVLWSENYEAALSDVFGIQADIANRIADALESKLSPAERTALDRPPTRSLEAYSLYLRAVALYREAGGVGVALTDSARESMHAYLDGAIELDPDFADAYAWKANLDLSSLYVAAVPEGDWERRRGEWIDRVERNVAEALRLDPGSPMAYVASARLDFFRSRLGASRASLDRARMLNPNDSEVLQATAQLLGLLGDYSGAIDVARRALEVDPKNPGSYAPLSVALMSTGQYDAAAEAGEATIAAAPTSGLGYLFLARAEFGRGNSAKALEALRVAEQLLQRPSRNGMADLAVSFRRAGAIADAERLSDAFLRNIEGLHVNPAMLVVAFLASGDDERALRQARVTIDERPLGMDPFQLMVIQRNIWSLPVLERPEWLEVRAQMAYRE